MRSRIDDRDRGHEGSGTSAGPCQSPDGSRDPGERLARFAVAEGDRGVGGAETRGVQVEDRLVAVQCVHRGAEISESAASDGRESQTQFALSSGVSALVSR